MLRIKTLLFDPPAATSPPDRTPASHHPRKVLDSSVTTPAYSPPPAGTRRLPNVPPGAYVGDDAEVVNGELFFYAANALWRSDTTPQGTHPLDTGSGAASYASGIELAGNTLFFAGVQAGLPVGVELFKVVPRLAAAHVFYNRSAFDGNDAAANAGNDGAVAPDKSPLLPAGRATFANVTTYSRGLNGVMVDLDDPLGRVTADDFAFKAGRGGDPAGWADAPPPAVSVRRGAGARGADRVTFVWPDGALRDTWLQVTVNPTARTGLTAPAVFYFGNLPGETGDSAAGGALAVTPIDFARTRRALASHAPIENPHDFNRDGRVSPLDLAVVRSAAAQRRSLAAQRPKHATDHYVGPAPRAVGHDVAGGRRSARRFLRMSPATVPFTSRLSGTSTLSAKSG